MKPIPALSSYVSIVLDLDIMTRGKLIKYAGIILALILVGWAATLFSFRADIRGADEPVLSQKALSRQDGLFHRANTSHLTSVEKSVIPEGQVAYGDELTYTVIISATPGTRLGLCDPLQGMTYVGFVEQPEGVTHVDTISGTSNLGGVITGTLTVTPTNQITVSFVVEVGIPGTAGWTVSVTNKACVYPLGGTLGSCVWSNEVSNFASRPYTLHLPLVLKDFWDTFCTSCYYVDCVNGSDANPGTPPDEAWRTLGPVHTARFEPGSVVRFKRGCTWTGGLTIDDDGEEGNPIIFTAYGTGDRPTITNPGDAGDLTHGIEINADWVVVENLLVRDVRRAGVWVDGAHNIVRNVEVTDVGSGVTILGTRNLITGCYIHDLHMIVNTPGGNDDFGATGVKFYGSYNEVAHNRIERCRAPSYDYGVGGGAFEWFGDTDGNFVHHNWAADNDGFLELGGGSSRDTIVAYNITLNNGLFSWIHLSGPFASVVENFRVEHNTIVEVVAVETSGRVFNFHTQDVVTEDVFIVRNNTIYMTTLWSVCNKSSFAHDHNLYYLGNGHLGFPLGQGEMIADPFFVNLNEDNFRLQAWSPAIDAGVDLGYSRDFEGNTVPASLAPDIGAFEYQGTSQPPPTPTPIPSPTPLPTPEPNEVIVDDADPGFSTSFSQDTWQQYSQVGGQHYGATHYYNREIGTGEDTATWSFVVPQTGRYEVYAWWWEGAWRPTDVPYTINHLAGSAMVRVDQQDNGGQWNHLSTFEFQDQGSVMVSDDVSSGQDVVADAIRLVYVGPNEIIVDDADPGFSTSFSQDAWQQYTHVGGQHYGATHYYNEQVGTGEDTATWSFTVPQSGRYEVYAWWWEDSWRPADVPYTINHLDGSTTVRVDQQDNGGQWNLLGTFEFQDQGSVMVSDDVSSGQDVVADAIRLVYVGP